MGIRFYCPNGHRLNVKDFLAGKRGICPHCEVRFRIPAASEIPKGSPRIKPGSVAELSTTPAVSRRRNSPSSGAPMATLDMPAISIRAKSDEDVYSTEGDPIDESPDSVWYVRPPSGGQYGPAKGEVVRRWVAEGRVSADSLVWREGWTDWRLAGPIFPSIAGLNAIVQQPANDGDKILAIAPSHSAPLPIIPVSKRKLDRRKSVLAVVGLVMLILVLSIGLIAVLVMKS